MEMDSAWLDQEFLAVLGSELQREPELPGPWSISDYELPSLKLPKRM